MEEEEDLISQFKSLTGADDNTAKYYLLRTYPRNLQAAVNSFFDERTKIRFAIVAQDVLRVGCGRYR